jgi:hypothetical protein
VDFRSIYFSKLDIIHHFWLKYLQIGSKQLKSGRIHAKVDGLSEKREKDPILEPIVAISLKI